MFCKNCGKNLNNGDKFCTGCGQSIDGNSNPQQVVEKDSQSDMSTEDIKTARLLTILSIVFTYCSSAIAAFLIGVFGAIPGLEKALSAIAGISPLAGIVLLIVARVKYPKYKFAKILMWFDIIMIIIAIVSFILFALLCYVICSSIDCTW